MSEHPPSIVRHATPPPSESRPVVTPLQPSVVYATDDADQLDDQYEGRRDGFTYAREGHPNAAALASTIDWLEGVDPAWGAGVVTGSGMGAVTAALLGLLEAGDHVVGGDQLYGRSRRLLTHDLPRLGLEASIADPTDIAAFSSALRPNTKLILVEVVSNPTLRVADIGAISALAANRGVLLAVDNTFTTPRSFRPFAHGADVVIHSITKLLGGHSDVTLGYVAANTADRVAAIREAAVTWGLTPSPFDCWLAERGLHTFELRYDRAESTARLLADELAALDGVESVVYPTRHGHPDAGRASSLLGGRGGFMVGFVLDGGRDVVNAFLRAAAPIPFAPTLGDVATLLSHPASSSHRSLSPETRAALGIPEGYIRVSVGIEDPDLLIPHLTAAVAAATHTQG